MTSLVVVVVNLVIGLVLDSLVFTIVRLCTASTGLSSLDGDVVLLWGGDVVLLSGGDVPSSSSLVRYGLSWSYGTFFLRGAASSLRGTRVALCILSISVTLIVIKKVVNFLNEIIQPYNERVKIHDYFRDGNQ